MKTKISALALSLFLLAACSGSPAPASSGETSPTEAASAEAATEASSETPSGEPGSPILTNEEITAQIEAVAEACQSVIDGFVINIDEGMYPMPTAGEYASLRDNIAALGYPVHDVDFDTPNYEKVEDFCADVEAGRDAQLIVFWLHNTGIQAEIFTCQEGALSVEEAVSHFPSYDEPEQSGVVEFYGYSAVDAMGMTEDGWLRYSGSDQNGEWYEGFRVQPLGEESRELARKYLRHTAYYEGGLFSTNWDREKRYVPYLENMYLYFYQLDNGDYPSKYAVSNQDDGVSVQRVPSADFEALMMKHLPFSQEWYREWGAYLAAEDVYLFGMEVKYSTSSAEVIAHKENADGSLTLTVAEITMSGKDDGITHELTVADNPDGSFRYLSNTVLEEE